ncbi:MAG: TetR/AcrR family transcriptional regulator [Deltaproteobacteria bacterium]|nr:MAG: TetR/AcrR family transcriptional regulator [Deltaproteobacteria bacterium]
MCEGRREMAQKKRSRKDDIIRAAAKLFSRKGYERTSVRDIAREVGMRSGSIFYHFDSKEEILVEVMAFGIGKFFEAAEEALSHAKSPVEKLTYLFRAHLEALLVDEHRDSMNVLLYEWRSLSDEGREEIVKLRDRYEEIWQEVLDEAKEAGLIEGDTKVLRLMILGSLNWSVQWFSPKGPLSADELAEAFVGFIMRNKS